MQIRILDEQHNAVSWELRWPLGQVGAGLLVGMVLAATPLLFVHHALRWYLIAGVALVVLGVALAVALTTPLWERGAVERTPEGGAVSRERRWLLRRAPELWEAPLEAFSGVGVANRITEETDGATTSVARVWLRSTEGDAIQALTGWASPSSAQALAESFAKAARLSLEELG
jgi:hypothetical protein